MADMDQATDLERAFLATASHEIRTPLNGILGTVSLLLETDLTPAQAEYAEAIRKSGARLLDLLNNVLDYARLDAGALETEEASLAPADVAREVVELLSPRAHQAGLDIAVCSAGADHLRGKGDAGRMRQILFNLVGNALKFTERGGVLVRVVETPAGVRYDVIDTGPGVAEADRARIFRAFRQASAADAGKDGGVGLGLAIVDRLTRALGGEVSVTSAPGVGSIFSVALPIAGLRRGAESVLLPPLRVALTGLPPATGFAAAATLANAGARPVWIGVEALKHRPPFDVILAGAEVSTAELKRLSRLAPLIVVLRPEDRAALPKFQDAGATGWLIRPLREASLLERVGLAKEKMPAPTADAGAGGRSRRVLIADDNPVNALIAQKALEKSGFVATLAATGGDAVEAASALQHALILMDLRMPVMDGFEAMRRLREAGVGTPIIAISAEINPQIERDARSAGADAVASKPLDVETLRRLADTWATPGKSAA